MKRRVLLLVSVVAALVMGYFVFFYEGDEDRIRSRLGDLAEAGSFSQGTNPAIYGVNLKAALKEAMAPGATVDALELGGNGLGPDEVLGGATQVAGRFQSAQIVFRDVKVTVTRPTATAEGKVLLQATEHGGAMRVEERGIRFDFARVDGAWKITRVVLAPPV